MVRLKAVRKKHTSKFFIISIPYGAIKRNHNQSSLKSRKEFQFLMVRLKVSNDDGKLKIKYYFNSLWCD